MSALLGFVDRYAARDSAVHRADARVKVPAALITILAISLTHEGAWGVLALLVLPIAILAAVARFSPAFMLGRSLLALPFVAVALPLVFTRPGETLFVLPLLGWHASLPGAIAVATICAKSWLSVLVAVLLTATTPVTEVLRALRALRVPRLLVGTVFFTYRYFFVIGEEALRLMRARDSRSAALPGLRGGGSVRWRAGVLGHMVGALFTRSLDRSERVYAAMQARGYAGDLVFLDQPALRSTDAWAGALVAGYALAVAIGGRLA